MKNATFKIFTMSFALLFLTGCYNVHQIWVDQSKAMLGKNIALHKKFHENPRLSSYVREEVLLPNGNIEAGYDDGFMPKRNGKYPCRYYYEYEPKSGLIVGFRFEEDFKHACVVSGA